MRSGAHVDPLTRHSPALRSTGRIIRRPPWDRVKLAPIHSVSSWKFSRFSARLCAGATVVRSFFEFRSVSLCFVPFVWLSIGGVRSFIACAQYVWWKFEFLLWFSAKVCGALEFLCNFLSFLRLIADSIVVEVLLAVFLWFAEVNEKDEKQSFQSRGSCRC